jgi:uncharacterized repeat protein (TIGR01451 family)
VNKLAALLGAKVSLRTIAPLLFLAQLWVANDSSAAGQPRTLNGHVPAVTAHLPPIGRLPSDRPLRLAIGIPLRNSAQLEQLLADIYNPSSPGYRRYLTPGEFTQSFGPSQQEYEALIQFAKANRLTVTELHPNRVLLDVAGSVADIEKAFNIQLMVYQHPTENRTFYAPDSEPSVDPAVPILDISGLDNFALPRPLMHKSDAQRPRALFGSGSGGAYFGKDFRAAYAPNVAVTGIGQAVGLLEFDGYYAIDISAYETQAGLPKVPLSNVLLDNYNGNPGSANIEVALDIEMAVAMAPGLTQIIVYEAGPNGLPNDILNRMVTDNTAKQLSSSWSWSGGPSSTTDNIFLQMAAQGQSFFQASGDSDAYSGAVAQPCDNPYITVVGGTTLSTSGPGGAWVSETTWNWATSGGGTNGSSGGVSTTYPIPSWQQPVSMMNNQGSTARRNIPDVALTADNIWVTYNNGGAGVVGGTSAAAPLWAAYAALINQQALANGKPVVGFLNPSLYSLAQGSGYGTAFHDILTGNNTNSASPTKFFAVSGFDLCTGWGTPAGSGLINALAGAPAAVIASNSLTLLVESCTNNAVDPNETVTMSFGLINIGSANTTNLVATLQASGGVSSPSATQTFGALSAGGAAVSRSFTFAANGACGGTITATLQLQDGGANLGTVTFAVRLGAPTIVNSFSESYDGAVAPALPAGWSSAVASGLLGVWTTTNGVADTAPNSAFAADSGASGQTDLVSPAIPILSASAQLSFRHNYNLAFRTISHPRSTTYYDGGVLQISIGGGAFTDILAAGGSFSSGGYNVTLATGTLNPLGGSLAWSGNSGGWVTSTAILPAAAAGQTVQLKWTLGTGVNSSVGVGWFVDSISIQDTSFVCCSSSADVGVSQSATPDPVGVGQNLTYTLSVSNAGPSMASSVVVTDSLPGNVSFVSASPGCLNQGNAITCTIGSLSAGAISNVLITIKPLTTGTLTNSATVAATPTDPDSANNSSLSTVSVYLPPSITAQPTNQLTNVGGSAGFYVTANGTAPLTYQWYFGGTPLAAATDSGLMLTGVQANQAGNYSVVVGNAVGVATSAVATLTVVVPPSVTVQPTNSAVALGASTVFQVGASGTAPLSYQWMFNGTALGGANASALNLSNVQTNESGNYCVVITNSAGAITSSLAVLTVLSPPTVSSQPVDQTIVVGSNVTFQAGVTGSSPLTYQWWFGGTMLSGQTTASLGLSNVQLSQAGGYKLVANNSVGVVTSAVAQLTVLAPPIITTQPTNQSAAVGTAVNLQVNAAGSAPLTYQWCFNATNSIEANTNVLTLANLQLNQAGQYTVIVTNAAGSITSAVAIVTVGTPPAIQQQPSSLTLVQGQTGSFNLSAAGDAPLSYQWRFNGTALPGATMTNYSLANVSSGNAGNYDAVVTDPYGSITSSVAQLTIIIPPTIGTQPVDEIVSVGSNTAFQVVVSGSDPIGYQWLFNGTNAVGGNTNVLSLGNAQMNMSGGYTVVATNLAGAVTSLVAQLTVLLPPTITTQPTNTTSPVGGAADFVAAVAGSGPLSYQWMFNGATLPGATQNELHLSDLQANQAGNYFLLVTNLAGSATSTTANLRVLVPPLASDPVQTASGLSVPVSSVEGLSYSLEYKNALSDATWTPATTSLPGTGGILILQDTNSTASSRFYRVHCQ